MVNTPSPESQPLAGGKSQADGCPPDCDLPENAPEALDARLDHAIEETFPTSDPVSVMVTKGAGGPAPGEPLSGASDNRGSGARRTAEGLVREARQTLGSATESASGAARDAYQQSRQYLGQQGRHYLDQGREYLHQARERYPEAERLVRESGATIRQRVAENPWPALLVAAAAGFALGWLMLGRSGDQDEDLPDYARTRQGYSAQRGKRHGA